MSTSTEDRYLIVSTDGHAGLLPEKYRDYVDPQYRELFDVHVAAEVAQRAAKEKDFLIKDFNDKWRSGNEDKLAAAWDSDLRAEVADGDGLAAEVLFPDGITERNAHHSVRGSASSPGGWNRSCSGLARAPTTAGWPSSVRCHRCGVWALRLSRCSTTSTTP